MSHTLYIQHNMQICVFIVDKIVQWYADSCEFSAATTTKIIHSTVYWTIYMRWYLDITRGGAKLGV